jgi:cellulose synthase/poly-beta-1,6-N-acetylglucosamine synthase-like glycosyltransferase
MTDFQPPRIAPVPEGIPRPLWSVMIPTFNCAHLLRETLQSVLQHNYPPGEMQIEVVDDCSTQDDSEAVVYELGQNRVSFFRQPKNLGHTGNFLTCLERSRGKIIHILHGDDLVRLGFYPKMEHAFCNPDAGAAFCRHIYAQEDGHWSGISQLEQRESGILQGGARLLASQQRIQTPSMVVKREVYEKLGGFDPRLSWTEDWEMWVRIAVNYPIWYEPEPLAIYRQHKYSSTSRKKLTGESLRDARRCIEIISEYFPEDTATELKSVALRGYALYAIDTARELAGQNQSRAACIQLREAIKCKASFEIFAKIMRGLAVHFLRKVRLVNKS